MYEDGAFDYYDRLEKVKHERSSYKCVGNILSYGSKKYSILNFMDI